MGHAIYKEIGGKKRCTGCHQDRPIDEFGTIKKQNGRCIQKARCKSCLVKATLYWRGNYRDKYRETRKKYNERNKERIKAKSYRQHATYRGIVCDLTDDFMISLFRMPCEYCGIKESLSGIDRVDNENGYVMGNVVPCCTTCNLRKKKMTKQEFLDWIKRVAFRQGFITAPK
jgi:hypothetical protein